MEYLRAVLVKELIRVFQDDCKRINHALRVLIEAEKIAESYEAESYGKVDMEVLIAAAVLHDIGIKTSEERLGYNTGKTQEEFGPPEAESILKSIGFSEERTTRVCRIIGNHHSPSKYKFPELEILKQADRRINRDE